MVGIIRFLYITMLLNFLLLSKVYAQNALAPIELDIKSTNKAAVNTQNSSLTVPQNISFDKCTKKYIMPVEDLYFFALASINANKFTINEIQSKNGYILFSAANKEFLASVNRVDPSSAILKITPADGNYFFPIGVLTNFFKYIDLNKDTKIEKISN